MTQKQVKAILVSLAARIAKTENTEEAAAIIRDYAERHNTTRKPSGKLAADQHHGVG